MRNEDLARMIMGEFNWWEIEDDNKDYNDILMALDTNDKEQINIIINYFIDNNYETKNTSIILKELRRRLV